MFLTAEIRKIDGQTLGVLILNTKVFKSGKEGWFGQGKPKIDGVRHQAQIQAVEIASKTEQQDD